MKYPSEKHIQEFNGDKFGFENLSKEILDEILFKMELPNCFGLYGNWGSGKSTLLNYIKQHIEEEENEEYKKTAVIYFEAWKYEYSEQNDLLFALLNCIKKQSGVDTPLWKKLMVDVAVVASGVLAKLHIGNLQKTTEDFELIESEVLERHERWVDKVEEFQSSFEKVIEKVLEAKKCSRLIVIVDDLDRCLPENAVKLLEAIKNFLFIKNTLFILAIDRRIISEMVEAKYGLHRGYGDEYLMKIIHYYYELPIVNLKVVVDEIFSTHGIESTERQRQYIVNFLKQEAKEPRFAKHLLHQFAISVRISENAKQSLKEDKDGVQVQYLFVASYLLTTFPKLFSAGDSTNILRNIRDTANLILSGQNRNDEYSKVAVANSINSEVRNKVETILMHTINTGRESSPPRLIDVDRLSVAIRHLRFN